MNHTFRLAALVALIASSARCLAQASSSLPAIRPKVVELGELRDTTLDASLIPRETVLSPRGALIAYTTWHTDETLRIWDVRTRSSRIVQTGYSESIVWSPAGDAIAFYHESDQGSQEFLWVLRLNPVTGESNGSPQRVSLTPTTGSSPQFSPDGKSIAFPREDPGGRSSLVVVPAAGGTERVLASGYNIARLRWAVDGGAIYYVFYQDSAKKKPALGKVALNGGTPQLMHDFSGERVTPILSADNRVVLFSDRTTAGERTTHVGNLTGRALATLSVPAGVDVNWGPSGMYRQVGVRETNPRGLRIVNVADGKSLALIDSTADVQAVAWFEDSRRIAALVYYDGTGVLVTMNADGTGIRKIPLATPPTRFALVFAPGGLSLQVSPDGRYAAYLGGGSFTVAKSLELVDLSTGKQQTLARASRIMQPFWHRDSRTIRYQRLTEVAPTDPSWQGVHDVSLDGTDKPVREFPQSQYPNAAWLVGENYVSIFLGNTTSLARLDGSPDQLLLRAPTRGPGVVSHDGRTIAAVSPGSRGSTEPAHKVILVSLSDGGQRTVDLPFADTGCGHFSPDGRYLYCMGREADSGPQTLYEVPVDGSKPRVVSRIDSREKGGVTALSPDGKWMLQTVAGTRRTAFVSLDFTDGMTRLLSSSVKP